MRLNVRKMVLGSLFAAMIALCAWLSIPAPPIVVTMQTFAVLLTLGVLGGKWGSVSVFIYLAMGMVGLPVFAGFRGGVSALLDVTGGFLWGFAAGCLVYRVGEKLGKFPAMVLCQLACAVCGCLWFRYWAGDLGFGAALLSCVIPYLIPDGIKLWLAWRISSRIGRQLNRNE